MPDPRARPAPSFATRVQVRFPEVDSYGVVWHAHYLTYIEVARHDLLGAAGFSPAAALASGYKLPITRFEVTVRSPALVDDELDISASLRPPRTAKLELDFRISRAGDGKLLTTGTTEHVVLGPSGELLLTFPAPIRLLAERILAFQEGRLELPAAPLDFASREVQVPR
jgi:acyl-CoA thioester hydrolase